MYLEFEAIVSRDGCVCDLITRADVNTSCHLIRILCSSVFVISERRATQNKPVFTPLLLHHGKNNFNLTKQYSIFIISSVRNTIHIETLLACLQIMALISNNVPILVLLWSILPYVPQINESNCYLSLK